MAIEPRNFSDRMVIDEALARGAGVKLPFRARGLSAKEMGDYHARVDRFLVPLAVLAGWGFLVPFLSIARALDTVTYLLVGTAGTILGLTLWYRHVRRRRSHCTPDVRVEVAPDLITLRADGRVHALRYEDVEFKLKTWSTRSATHFGGIVLESPLGPLHLEDGYFKPGTNAAAAILRILNGDTA